MTAGQLAGKQRRFDSFDFGLSRREVCTAITNHFVNNKKS